MDAIKFLAAKAKGAASIIRHGDTTLLVSMPAGFDPATGDPLPNDERGYQPADIIAMRDGAAANVLAARDTLANAEASLAAFDVVVAEVLELVPAAPAEPPAE